ATKQFDPSRKISPEDWATLENALILSPSSYGLQPWRFVVISDQKNARETFSFDMETATDSRLLALRRFCRAHRDDRSRHRSTHCAHGRSARRNGRSAEKISRRDGWRRSEWTAGGASARLGSAASLPRDFHDERGAHRNRHLPNGRIQPG